MGLTTIPTSDTARQSIVSSFNKDIQIAGFEYLVLPVQSVLNISCVLKELSVAIIGMWRSKTINGMVRKFYQLRD